MEIYTLNVDGYKCLLTPADEATERHIREMEREGVKRERFVRLSKLEPLLEENGCGHLVSKIRDKPHTKDKKWK